MTAPGAFPKPVDLRDAIAQSVRVHVKSYDVPDFCDRIGMRARTEGEGDPFSSKAGFVHGRINHLDTPALVLLAMRILREWDDDDLERLIGGLNGRGVGGDLINIVFAADGPKPHIVLRDALNNRIEITRHAQHCLVYDRPLAGEGLAWADLVEWWVGKTAPPGREPDREAGARALWQRLNRSLANDPEQLLFRNYAVRYGSQLGPRLPALLPQVYLHYDPFAAFGQATLMRQRMDFLLLLPGRVRVVLEIDGQQHYSDDGRPSPTRYAAMVSEDRQLRLAGYEVYRFGGQEFVDPEAAWRMLSRFFDQLLATHVGAQLAQATADPER